MIEFCSVLIFYLHSSRTKLVEIFGNYCWTRGHARHLHQKLILSKKVYKNKQIRAKKVRLIDREDEHQGVVSLKQALKKAKQAGLDLVQVTSNTKPPVCKIIDYGKYVYRQQKKEKRKKKGQTATEQKNIRLGFNISDHDLKTRVREAQKFLEQGHKVKVEMRLYGRQKARGDFAKKTIKQFLETLAQKVDIKIEGKLKRKGGNFNLIITKK